MKKIITIVFLSLIVISFSIDNEKKIKTNHKPEFKEALIELLIQYPKVKFNNENNSGKIGLGIGADSRTIFFTNYSSDKIDGRFEVYNRKTGTIQYKDSLVNGKSVGPVFAYRQSGTFWYSIYNIENSDTLINNDQYKNYKPTYKGYLTLYNSENNILEEGTAFYDESIEIDFIKGSDWVEKK